MYPRISSVVEVQISRQRGVCLSFRNTCARPSGAAVDNTLTWLGRGGCVSDICCLSDVGGLVFTFTLLYFVRNGTRADRSAITSHGINYVRNRVNKNFTFNTSGLGFSGGGLNTAFCTRIQCGVRHIPLSINMRMKKAVFRQRSIGTKRLGFGA